MTRLRYIVDRPRGPRGGNHDEPYAFKCRKSAERAAEPRVGRRVRAGGLPQVRTRPAGTVFEIDLDALQPVNASLEDQFTWHEQRMQHHAAEAMRLRPLAARSATVYLTTSDMARIREAVARWYEEENRLRRGGGATPAADGAFFLLRDLWREGKLG